MSEHLLSEHMVFPAGMTVSEVNITIGQMLTLLQNLYEQQRDAPDRVAAMAGCDWFPLLCGYVLGRPSGERRELQRHKDKAAACIMEAIADFYDRTMIAEVIYGSLSSRLEQLEWQLCSEIPSPMIQRVLAMAETLRQRLSDGSNETEFERLLHKIEGGFFFDLGGIGELCKILAYLRYEDMQDDERMERLRQVMTGAGLLSTEEITIEESLQELSAISREEVGRLYMELSLIRNHFPADLFTDFLEQYHFLPDEARIAGQNRIVIRSLLHAYNMAADTAFPVAGVFEGFLMHKRESMTPPAERDDWLQLAPVQNEDDVAETMLRTTKDPKLRQAEALYVRCRFKEAFNMFLELAESGNGRAMYFLGKLAENSEFGVKVEQAAHGDWWKKGAACGDPLALLNLSYEMLGSNHDSTRQFSEIVPTVKAMAETGDIIAQNEIADCYFYGVGVKENEREAVRWYRRAAEQGYAPAQCNLGFCYEAGNGVDADATAAFRWYGAAAKHGFAKAQYKLGVCYFYGNGTEADSLEAAAWFEKAAMQDYAPAQCSLGLCYETGSGVERDKGAAVEMYRRAAEQGFAEAQYHLGACYSTGKGVMKSQEETIRWYRMAAEQGYVQAECELGFCYVQGYGVMPDYREAVRWFRQAADQGYAKAQYNLGYCYAQGTGVNLNHREAVRWYKKAAEQGYAWAQCNLGYHYEKGLGVKRNYNLAKRWYKAAIAQGNRNAMEGFYRVERTLIELEE